MPAHLTPTMIPSNHFTLATAGLVGSTKYAILKRACGGLLVQYRDVAAGNIRAVNREARATKLGLTSCSQCLTIDKICPTDTTFEGPTRHRFDTTLTLTENRDMCVCAWGGVVCACV